MRSVDENGVAEPSPREFGKALVGHWTRWMSGVLSIVFSVASFFVAMPVLRAILILEAVAAAGLASYTIWSTERKDVARLTAILTRRRPHIVPHVVVEYGSHHLYVTNVGNVSAIAVKVANMRGTLSVFNFVPVQLLVPNYTIQVRISRTGPARDLWELCDEVAFAKDAGDAWDSTYGQTLVSSTGSISRDTSKSKDIARSAGHEFALSLSYSDVDGGHYVDHSYSLQFSNDPAVVFVRAAPVPAENSSSVA